jgi:hypothetical protein
MIRRKRKRVHDVGYQTCTNGACCSNPGRRGLRIGKSTSAAFNNEGLVEPVATLIDKVAKSSHKVTDEDIAAAKVVGLSEDQIFELVVCAAIGQAARQYDSARTALMTATEKELVCAS